jgi:hypothetical protein
VALVAPTQEKCDAASTPSAKISLTVLNVPACVEPPAPKVTEQNSGFNAYKAWRTTRSLSKPSVVLGGKNSKLIGKLVVILIFSKLLYFVFAFAFACVFEA